MNSTDKLTELREDVIELESILKTVSRQNVRQIIVSNITTLKANIDTLERDVTKPIDDKPPKLVGKPNVYTSKINTYGWDENSKFVKIYITIPQIESLLANQLSCSFTEKSFNFTALNHLGKNHQLHVVTLANQIRPDQSSCKIKSGNVLILLKKAKENETWGHLTEVEKKIKEAKESKMDTKDLDASDPQAGIMNLMKKMYDDGDDEMKKMIKKTWYESQQKQKEGNSEFAGL